MVRRVELLTLRVTPTSLPQVERRQTVLDTETAAPLPLLAKALARCGLGHEARVWGLDLRRVRGLLDRGGRCSGGRTSLGNSYSSLYPPVRDHLVAPFTMPAHVPIPEPRSHKSSDWRFRSAW